MVTSKQTTPTCSYLNDIVHYTSLGVYTMFRPGFVTLFVTAVASLEVVGQLKSANCVCVVVSSTSLTCLVCTLKGT